MRKIKTLFQRNPDDRRYLLPEVEPGCEWVLEGEGIPTRKFDGTCVMFDGIEWWARREVKAGKGAPEGFVEEQHDETTGKTVGWEPAGQSGFARWLDEAAERHGAITPGTYELIGPKINGNAEGWDHHAVIRHGEAVFDEAPRDYDGLRLFLTALPYEGIVWHHADGRMVKIKKRDFPR